MLRVVYHVRGRDWATAGLLTILALRALTRNLLTYLLTYLFRGNCCVAVVRLIVLLVLLLVPSLYYCFLELINMHKWINSYEYFSFLCSVMWYYTDQANDEVMVAHLAHVGDLQRHMQSATGRRVIYEGSTPKMCPIIRHNWKRCKRRCKLVLFTHMKSHTGFRSVWKLVTLNDLERRNGRYFVLLNRIR